MLTLTPFSPWSWRRTIKGGKKFRFFSTKKSLIWSVLRHFVDLPLCQPANLSTLPFCHLVDLLLCQLSILSTCYFVIFLLGILSFSNSVIYSFLSFVNWHLSIGICQLAFVNWHLSIGICHFVICHLSFVICLPVIFGILSTWNFVSLSLC